MSEFKIHRLKAYNGDIIEIRETQDGQFVCPVCGLIFHADAPWAENWPINETGQPIGERHAIGSQDICPCCDTQWGYTDAPDDDAPGAVERRWFELRQAWLRQTDLTPEIAEQLSNLGISSPTE